MESLERSNQLRKNNLKNGLVVPPALILSITSQCNLGCDGCFASATGVLDQKYKKELKLKEWYVIIEEAKKLGVYCFVIAGGEPFLKEDITDLCSRFHHQFFIILTNGTTINQKQFIKLKKIDNAVILVSIEGGEKLTNNRRGQGIYQQAMNTLKKIDKTGTPTGISVTITRKNFRYWTNNDNIDALIRKGIKIGVFIEYIPTSENNCHFKENDHHLMLTENERKKFRKKMLYYRDNKKIFIIHSPGDEEFFGGCVSAGRGFAHVTPNGDLTPCPISDVATHNLTQSSLKEGLSSDLFNEIRENDHLLETNGMPCALFAHPKEVDSLAKKVNAYRTNQKKNLRG